MNDDEPDYLVDLAFGVLLAIGLGLLIWLASCAVAPSSRAAAPSYDTTRCTCTCRVTTGGEL